LNSTPDKKEIGVYLYINPSKIKERDTINLSVGNSKLIKISPDTIEIKKRKRTKMMKKRINIVPSKEGSTILTAKNKKHKSECLINIEKKELPIPENGLMFASSNFTAPPKYS